ncbi:hypothetical protein GCM10027047_02540 [Rhodococcus aerolatus]
MRLPAPREVVVTARGSARYALDAAVFVALLPVRVAALISQVEALLAKVDRVVDEASVTVGDAQRVARAAGQVVLAANETSNAAQELLALYEPIARRGAPMLGRFVEEFDADELEAAIRMVDQLPALTEAMVDDIMPILGTLDRVGPDIHNLLDVAKDVREAVIGIPGFSFFRKRGEHKIDPEKQPEERAEE